MREGGEGWEGGVRGRERGGEASERASKPETQTKTGGRRQRLILPLPHAQTQA